MNTCTPHANIICDSKVKSLVAAALWILYVDVAMEFVFWNAKRQYLYGYDSQNTDQLLKYCVLYEKMYITNIYYIYIQISGVCTSGMQNSTAASSCMRNLRCYNHLSVVGYWLVYTFL